MPLWAHRRDPSYRRPCRGEPSLWSSLCRGLCTTAVLALSPLLLPLQGCGVHPAAAVGQQWTSAAAWDAAAAAAGNATTAAMVAGTGKTAGSEERRLGRGGGDSGEGIGRRCWKSEDGPRRCYANVFFFGVSKCGTTSLAYWMAQHPTLRWVSNFGNLGKGGFEAHVLQSAKAIIKPHLLPTSKERYAALAPEAEEGDRVIDYTPHYAIVAAVPYRIHSLYGNSSFDGSTKYLVSLREPVARAISSWEYKFNMYALKKKADIPKSGEARPLVEAFREGMEDVNGLLGCLEQHPRPPEPSDRRDYVKDLDLHKCRIRNYLGDNLHLLRHHVGKSMYALQLERWFTLFGRENFKVIFLEELHDDPVGTLEGIFEFIGLDLLDSTGKKGLANREEWERIVQTDSNATEDERKEKLGPQVTPELVQTMRDFFAPHNARLEELLGRPLPENWSLPAAL